MSGWSQLGSSLQVALAFVACLGALGKDLLPISFRLLTDPVPHDCTTEVPISGPEASQGHSLLLEVAPFLLVWPSPPSNQQCKSNSFHTWSLSDFTFFHQPGKTPCF